MALAGLAVSACSDDERPPPISDEVPPERSETAARVNAAVEDCGLLDDLGRVDDDLVELWEAMGDLRCMEGCYLDASCDELEFYWGVLLCQGDCAGIDQPRFTCDDGYEVPDIFVCDAMDDCRDGSDERGCTYFACDGGQPVWSGLLCDGVDDCADGSDEGLCSSDGRVECDAGETQVPVEWVCDGRQDCTDGSDESPCVSS